MISAFLSGYRITNNSKYFDMAKKSIDFFESNFEKNISCIEHSKMESQN